MQSKLHGTIGDLRRTASFITTTAPPVYIYYSHRRTKRRRRLNKTEMVVISGTECGTYIITCRHQEQYFMIDCEHYRHPYIHIRWIRIRLNWNSLWLNRLHETSFSWPFQSQHCIQNSAFIDQLCSYKPQKTHTFFVSYTWKLVNNLLQMEVVGHGVF